MTEELKSIFFIVAAFLAAGLVAFLTTPLAKKFAYKIGAIDIPKDERRMHKVPIPRMGGLAIFLGFIVSVLIFVDITTEIRGILLGAVIIAVLGILDDVLNLPAWLKFIVQIIAAGVAVLHGVRIDFFGNPVVFGRDIYILAKWLSIPVTIFWIVFITNSVNLIDGLDGLAVGVSAISSVTLVVVTIIDPDIALSIAVIMAALAGSCVGFIPYNRYPAKIFMGDTGSTFLGYILGAVSVLGLFKFNLVITYAIPFLIIGLPIFDTASSIIRRLLKGQNPMKPDKKHIHHKLINLGFNQKQAVAILYAITVILGIAAVILAASGTARTILLVVDVIVAVITAFKITKMGIHHHQEALLHEAEEKKAEQENQAPAEKAE